MKNVTLKALSEALGMDRSHLRKYVLALGIEPFKMRNEDSGRQLTLAVSQEEARRIKQSRADAGFVHGSVAKSIESGQFYIILLDPVRPDRVKLGFSVNAGDRLLSYKTSNPLAKILGHWPCHRTWEKCAIAALTCMPKNMYRVSEEVFDCRDMDSLLKLAEAFFAMLPVPSYRPGLSKNSPLVGLLDMESISRGQGAHIVPGDEL